MKRIFTLLIIAITVNAFSQTNLVPNYDFEKETDIVGGEATGWTNSGADTREIVAPGQDSPQAFQISGDANKGAQYITDGSTELAATDYIISFWAKGTQGESAKFKVKFADATTKTVVGTAFKETGVWEFFTLSFALSEVMYVDKYLLQCNSASQTFVADNLFFGEGEPDPVDPIEPEFTDFPFTEDFEDAAYVVGNTLASSDGTTESDSWAVDNGAFDRFWRGNATNGYTCTVTDDAYMGSNAMVIDVTNQSGKDLRLRTVNIPVGDYRMSFYAKTDVAGEGNAKVGFNADENTWSTLTTEYKKYEGTGTVSVSETNGTTRLIIFYTSGASQAEDLEYKVIVDNIVIEEDGATSIDKPTQSNSITMYPNPVESQLFIQSGYDVDVVEIFNLAGMKVKEYRNVVGAVNVADLASGLYIVSVTSNGAKVTQKINKR